MKRCILCDKPLNNQNSSKEHIFLNSFGDTLTNNELICKQCNSELGDLVDSDIIKDLSPLTKMAGIYGSNHGKKPSSVNISVIGADDGEPYLFNTNNGSIVLKHPIVKRYKKSDHQVSIDVSLPTKNIKQGRKQFNHIVKKELNRYKKKHGKRPKISNKAKLTVRSSKEKLHVSISLHFKKYVFEILKMGTEFAITCGVNKKILMTNLLLLHIITKYPNLKDNPFPISKFRNMLYRIYFPVTYVPSDMKINYNKIQAKLWIEKGQLLFWVSIFGMLRYRVPLTSNVKGKGVAEYNGEGNDFYKLLRSWRYNL